MGQSLGTRTHGLPHWFSRSVNLLDPANSAQASGGCCQTPGLDSDPRRVDPDAPDPRSLGSMDIRPSQGSCLAEHERPERQPGEP
jgi:hypothetical protein